jgi:hypothetical protein
LTLWPLLLREDAPPCRAPRYLPLADALEAGALRVDELPGGARVPHVAVENEGDVAVLVLFGEELRGAMQNRIANASFLIGAHDRVEIDVSCVEAGRWGRRSELSSFSASRSVVSQALRRKMAMKVTSARGGSGRFVADQGEVWEEVGQRVSHSGARSATGAYADYLRTRARDLAEMAKAFHPLPGQAGFVAAIGDDVAGLEVVGRPEVFARVFPTLLRAYLIDAVDAAFVRGREALRGRFDAPEPFLEAITAARTTVGRSLGLGEDVRLEGAVCGCALVVSDVVHLTAFPAEVARSPLS